MRYIIMFALLTSVALWAQAPADKKEGATTKPAVHLTDAARLEIREAQLDLLQAQTTLERLQKRMREAVERARNICDSEITEVPGPAGNGVLDCVPKMAAAVAKGEPVKK
jgi:hypothetical protein